MSVSSNVGALSESATSMLMPHQIITVGGIGHRELDAQDQYPYVHLCFHRILSEMARRFPRLKVVSALSTGADTLFAQCARTLSIPLESIIPFASFDGDFADNESNARYLALRGDAIREHRLNFAGQDVRAYRRSMEWVVFRSDIVIAAWDGRNVGSPGGTWNAVSLCATLGRPLIQVDTVNKTLNLRVGHSGELATQNDLSIRQIMRQL